MCGGGARCRWPSRRLGLECKIPCGPAACTHQMPVHLPAPPDQGTQSLPRGRTPAPRAGTLIPHSDPCLGTLVGLCLMAASAPSPFHPPQHVTALPYSVAGVYQVKPLLTARLAHPASVRPASDTLTTCFARPIHWDTGPGSILQPLEPSTCHLLPLPRVPVALSLLDTRAMLSHLSSKVTLSSLAHPPPWELPALPRLALPWPRCDPWHQELL